MVQVQEKLEPNVTQAKAPQVSGHQLVQAQEKLELNVTSSVVTRFLRYRLKKNLS